MKNQYVGDIGDYGKYGLLRFLQVSGIEIGINWYLTPDDGRTDGEHTEYLDDVRMRVYDPEIFDSMQRIMSQKSKNIMMVEKEEYLKDCIFYNAMMDFSGLNWQERARARLKWHDGAMKALQDVELVFADPDNGLSLRQKPTWRNAEKYIMPSEIVGYYKRDQQVLYYQHRSRKNTEEWLEEKRHIKTYLPDAKLLALSFHRWSARTYIFVIHENKIDQYNRIIEAFVNTAWGTHKVDGKLPFRYDTL